MIPSLCEKEFCVDLVRPEFHAKTHIACCSNSLCLSLSLSRTIEKDNIRKQHYRLIIHNILKCGRIFLNIHFHHANTLHAVSQYYVFILVKTFTDPFTLVSSNQSPPPPPPEHNYTPLTRTYTFRSNLTPAENVTIFIQIPPYPHTHTPKRQ